MTDLVQKIADAVWARITLPDVYEKADIQEAIRQALAQSGEAVAFDSDLFERAYAKGYRAALSAAAAECRRVGTALDNGDNEYTRYPEAIKLAVSIQALRVPGAYGDDAADYGRVADDATLERIIDAAAGEWHDDEFRITGSDLMQMLRAVARLRCDSDRVAELDAQAADWERLYKKKWLRAVPKQKPCLPRAGSGRGRWPINLGTLVITHTTAALAPLCGTRCGKSAAWLMRVSPSPPCSDCVDYGYLREAIRDFKAAEADEQENKND